MGILGDVFGGLGDIAKFAAPVAAFIPGVGPLAAAGIGAGGAALGKLNDKNVTAGNTFGDMAKFGAWGGIGGYGAQQLGNASGGLGGIPGAVWDYVKANPGQAAQILGSVGGMVTGAQKSGKANAAMEEYMRQSMARQAQRQPYMNALQTRMFGAPGGGGGMVNSQAPRADLGAIGGSTQNPFAQQQQPISEYDLTQKMGGMFGPQGQLGQIFGSQGYPQTGGGMRSIMDRFSPEGFGQAIPGWDPRQMFGRI
jgi:hypothetical protein